MNRVKELFYEIGYLIESISASSMNANHFYRNLCIKPSGPEVKHLVEEANFKEVRKEAIHGSPFTYRKFLKEFYEERKKPHMHPGLLGGELTCNGECLESKI